MKDSGRVLGGGHPPERGLLCSGGCNQTLFGSLEGMRFGAGPLPLLHKRPWSWAQGQGEHGGESDIWLEVSGCLQPLVPEALHGQALLLVGLRLCGAVDGESGVPGSPFRAHILRKHILEGPRHSFPTGWCLAENHSIRPAPAAPPSAAGLLLRPAQDGESGLQEVHWVSSGTRLH